MTQRVLLDVTYRSTVLEPDSLTSNNRAIAWK